MKLIRDHWFDAGPILAVLAIGWAIFARMEGLQLILLLNLVVLFLHEFEEYRWPGGEPWILNEVFQRKGGPADRYPVNKANTAFVNITAWVFYLIPVFFPHVIWLGLAPVLMGMAGQLVVHGIITNRKLKTWYNPGLAAVVLGHVPLGIWYIIEAYRQGGIGWADWLFGIIYLAAFMAIVMQWLTTVVLADRNSPHPFTPDEMARFDRERRLAHAGIEPLPMGPSDPQPTDAPRAR